MTSGDVGIRWGAFSDASEEHAFRLHHFDVASRQAVLAIAFTTLFSWASVRNDFTLNPGSDVPYYLLALRLFHAIVGVSVWVVARCTRSPVAVFNTVGAWIFVTALSKFVLLTTRPADFHGHESGDVVFLLITPLALPIPFPRQVASMFLFAACDAVIATKFRTPVTSAIAIARISTYGIAITLGTLTAYRLQTVLRQQYRVLREESELRESLSVALSEVRTLRGILPICSGCHGIRDDEGYWHTVEAYVHEHTHAKSSHGLCPNCVKRLYPEIADQVLDAVKSAKSAGTPEDRTRV